jgi:hypothetical protein
MSQFLHYEIPVRLTRQWQTFQLFLHIFEHRIDASILIELSLKVLTIQSVLRSKHISRCVRETGEPEDSHEEKQPRKFLDQGVVVVVDHKLTQFVPQHFLFK